MSVAFQYSLFRRLDFCVVLKSVKVSLEFICACRKYVVLIVIVICAKRSFVY